MPDWFCITALHRHLPYSRRKLQGFFSHFYEFDTIVVATYPTCHLETLQTLLSFRLPQRYIAMVHNPGGMLRDAAAAS